MTRKDSGDYVRFRCKACGKRLKVRAEHEGGDIIPCPRCHSPVTVPIANPAAILGEAASGRPAATIPEPGAETSPADPTVAASGPGRWSPDATLGRLRELDSLRAMVARVDEATVETIQRMLRQPKLERDVILPEVRRIAWQREEAVRAAVSSHRNDVEAKIKEAEGRPGSLTQPAQKRLAMLKRSLAALNLYVRFVLGMRQ